MQVTDEGGGIPRSGVPKIFTYLYSTAESPLDALNAAGEGEDSPAALAGYGYGLPLSRLYARYFGGDLQVGLARCPDLRDLRCPAHSQQPLLVEPAAAQVISMEGYGTDAYLHLNRLGNSEEPLR